MNLKEWKQQGKYLTYKNNQVFYRENGNGRRQSHTRWKWGIQNQGMA